MENREVTQQDLDSLQYFWEAKGNIERYSEYEKIEEDLKENYPEVIKAWNDFNASRTILSHVLNGVELKEEV